MIPRAHRLRALVGDFAAFAGAKLWVALLLMLGGAIAEGVGLIMIVPLAAVAIGEDSAIPQSLTPLVEALPRDGRLAGAVALFLGAMALRSVLLYLRDRELAGLRAEYQASLQLRSAGALAAKGWSEAGRLGQAGIQSLLLNDIPRVSTGISFILEMIVSGIMLAVQLALVAALTPSLTLFAVLIVAPFFLIVRMTTRRLSRIGQAFVVNAEESTGAGMRLHTGLKAALAQGTVAQFMREYDRSLRRLAEQVVAFARDLAVSNQAAQFASALAAAALLVAGARWLDLPFATLAASLILFARMASPAMTAVRAAQQGIAMAPAFGAIEARLGPIGRRAAAVASSAEPLDWSRIEADGVTYRHASGGGIEGIDISIERGSWIGLYGPSGAGKTTLADLFAGLMAPQAGSIAVDGRSLDGAMLDRWRAGIAYVGQDGLVFADSAAGNLRADREDVSDEEMWQALDKVGLADRIRAVDGGLGHPLGERGALLSGGERQRLVIARAMLRRPSFIILDEATAALDPKSEAMVLAALRDLPSRPAAILVAHRDSTLRACDSTLAIRHEADG